MLQFVQAELHQQRFSATVVKLELLRENSTRRRARSKRGIAKDMPPRWGQMSQKLETRGFGERWLAHVGGQPDFSCHLYACSVASCACLSTGRFYDEMPQQIDIHSLETVSAVHSVLSPHTYA